MIRRAPTLLALALIALPALPALAQQPPPRPNILVLVADDWGFSDVGAFGSEIHTPNLDALARRGMRFANFHVAGSCSPTRAMLLTGVEHHKAGVGNLAESMPPQHRGQRGYGGSLNQRVVSLATLLRDAGYRTAITGKWNVGSQPHNLPPARGFERSWVQGDTGSDNWDPAQRYLPHAAQVQWFEDAREAQLPKRFYSSEFFVDKAIDYLRAGQASGKPFFAYVGFQANHVPLQAPQAFIDKYRGRYDAGWAALRQTRAERAAALGLVAPNMPLAAVPGAPDWAMLSTEERRYQARVMEVYAGMAEAMDYHAGRLLAYLRASGQLDNTIVVFLSDNGPEGSDYAPAKWWLKTQYSRDLARLGGPGAYAVAGPGWAGASGSPFYGYKFMAGEGGLRTPLILAGVPGMMANTVHQGFAHVTDIAPTLLDLAGVAHPGSHYRGQDIEPPSGRSLRPLLADLAARVRSEQESIGYELSGNAALFKGALKLVKNLPPAGDGQWHLYNLQTDPGETHDLQTEQPQLFAALQADYAAWEKEHGVLPMPEGYSAQRQVARNTLLNYFIPTYAPWVGAALIALAGLAGWGWHRRRQRPG